jgi:hypothetical protein
MLIGCDACLQYIEAEAENAEVINRRTTFSTKYHRLRARGGLVVLIGELSSIGD